MATWQSLRRKIEQKHSRWAMTPDQRRAARQRADERRMALPAPPWPIEHAPGAHRGQITWTLDGQVIALVHLHQPPKRRGGKRTRVDSFEARTEFGETLAEGGWHAIHRAAVARVIPRQLSRRQVAGL